MYDPLTLTCFLNHEEPNEFYEFIKHMKKRKVFILCFCLKSNGDT